MKKLLLILLLYPFSFNSYAHSVEPSPVIEIEVPVYMCGDLVVDFDKPDKPDKPDETDKPDEILLIDGIEYIEVKDVGWFGEKPVLIDLEPDHPLCNGQVTYEEPTYHPTSIYIEKLIVLSVLKCDGLSVNLEVEEISQNQIITYEDGKICSKYFKGQRCYENTDEAIEIFENGACSPYFESADCYSLMEKVEFIEKNLEPDNPACIEAENSKTNAPTLVRNGYGEMVERYNYKTPKYGSFVTVTEVSDDGITETSYLDKDLYIKHGKDIYWWRVGQKGVEKNYDNNVLNGKYTSWYDTGQIMGEGNYKDGKIVGKYTFWHRNGQIDSERTY